MKALRELIQKSEMPRRSSYLPDIHEEEEEPPRIAPRQVRTLPVTPRRIQYDDEEEFPLDESSTFAPSLIPVTPDDETSPARSSRSPVTNVRTYNRYDWSYETNSVATASSTTEATDSLHDACIIVGKTEFRHSRLILSYASPVLQEHLKLTSTIRFRNQNPDDWKMLCKFLEPHAVQQATLDQRNLPVLLPWFQQLQLSVLLDRCDRLLRHVLVKPHIRRSAAQDLHNVLRVAEIAKRTNLPLSLKAALSTCHAWLKKYPKNIVPSNKLTLLRALCHLLRRCQEADSSMDSSESSTVTCDPPEAGHVLKALRSFIPRDCQEFSDDHLLQNPLFPFLVRDGIRRAADDHEDEEDDDHEDVETTLSQLEHGLSSLFETLTIPAAGPTVSNSGTAKTTENNTSWLERIWKHLNQPPLFADDNHESVALPSSKKEKPPSRRTFSC